jgi:hypothetical protein
MSLRYILLKMVAWGLWSVVPHLSVQAMNVENSDRVARAKIELDLIYGCRETIAANRFRSSDLACLECLEKNRKRLHRRIRNFNDHYSPAEIAQAHEMREKERAEQN